jgi:hypothetical protein
VPTNRYTASCVLPFMENVISATQAAVASFAVMISQGRIPAKRSLGSTSRQTSRVPSGTPISLFQLHISKGIAMPNPDT